MNTDIFDSFPRFNLGSIELRELRTTDAEAYQQYMTTKPVTEFLTQENIPLTYADAQSDVNYWGSLFTSKRGFYWAISLNDRLIGSIGFNIWNRIHNRAEISYDLDHAHWGKGFMHKAMSQILDFGFNTMQLHRIQATVTVDNQKSIALLNRSGFVLEGILRGYEIVGGKYTDYYLYAKIRT